MKNIKFKTKPKKECNLGAFVMGALAMMIWSTIIIHFIPYILQTC